jgi:hypothetical protein
MYGSWALVAHWVTDYAVVSVIQNISVNLPLARQHTCMI